jgi:hypothetical protein
VSRGLHVLLSQNLKDIPRSFSGIADAGVTTYLGPTGCLSGGSKPYRSFAAQASSAASMGVAD